MTQNGNKTAAEAKGEGRWWWAADGDGQRCHADQRCLSSITLLSTLCVLLRTRVTHTRVTHTRVTHTHTKLHTRLSPSINHNTLYTRSLFTNKCSPLIQMYLHTWYSKDPTIPPLAAVSPVSLHSPFLFVPAMHSTSQAEPHRSHTIFTNRPLIYLRRHGRACSSGSAEAAPLEPRPSLGFGTG